MKTKFAEYLEKHNLEIYDLAKMLRDSEWNQINYRSREAFVRLLSYPYIRTWEKVTVKGKRKIHGTYSHRDGMLTAWRVAQVLECKEEDIV